MWYQLTHIHTHIIGIHTHTHTHTERGLIETSTTLEDELKVSRSLLPHVYRKQPKLCTDTLWILIITCLDLWLPDSHEVTGVHWVDLTEGDAVLSAIDGLLEELAEVEDRCFLPSLDDLCWLGLYCCFKLLLWCVSDRTAPVQCGVECSGPGH